MNLLYVRILILSQSSGMLQSETEQRPHKVSFYVQKDKAEDIMKSLLTRFKERGV